MKAGKLTILLFVATLLSQATPAVCRAQGLEGGVDVTLFNVYSNHGVGATGSSWFSDDNTVGNVRYWLGYQTSERNGIRLKYWDFFGSFDLATDVFDLKQLDGELTSDFSIGDWVVTGSAGVRWNEINYTDEAGAATRYRFNGIGPSIGVSTRRNILGNLNFVGSVGGAVAYGDTLSTSTSRASGVAVNTIDSQLALEYFVPVADGFLSLKGGW